MRRNIPSLSFGLRLGAMAIATSLAGCSAGPAIDRVPTELGGLPAGAPKRPTVRGAFPAVHDMPPPRASEPMNTVDQLKLESELSQARRDLEARKKPPQTTTR